MGPHSASFCARVRRRALFLGILVFPISLACEQKRQEEAPTEPWLKDEAVRKKDDAPVRIRFRVTPETTLSIALPTRRSKPVGKLSRIEGYVDFDLKDLALTSGQIHVELSSLQMNNLPPPDKSEAASEAPELYNDATSEALRWLGLGAEVSPRERKEHARAVFQFHSLRALSHPSAHGGALKQLVSGESTRQVLANAEGELSLRGFSVSRSFSTALEFRFPAADSELPESVEVTIRNGAVIPLGEYDIRPRGPDGNVDVKKSGLLGTLVGPQAHVTGSLFLKREGAPSLGQKKAK